jgi:N-acetylneuraminic acid mutarotase
MRARRLNIPLRLTANLDKKSLVVAPRFSRVSYRIEVDEHAVTGILRWLQGDLFTTLSGRYTEAILRQEGSPIRIAKHRIPSGILLICLIAISGSLYARAQTTAQDEWTWLGGSTSLGLTGIVPAVYGTLGTPAAANTPGSRGSAATWTDKSGNLWLFSGETYGEYYNDLWMLNPSTAQWTWMGGSNADVPGRTGGIAGVYGTLGTPSAGNTPGGRLGAVTWVDGNGHFWMFGGFGYDSAAQPGYLNDLWEFNPSTNQWAWMSGSSTIQCTEVVETTQCGQHGVYGVLGTSATTNIPGTREYAVGWTDSKGNFWLFGGYGYDSNGTLDNLNDLWEFNPTAGTWTWVSGANAVNHNNGQPGVYGDLGAPAGGNTPGGRTKAVSWTDTRGSLWLFGGYGTDSNDAIGILNDLWEFDTSKSQWTWMGGANAFGGLGGLPGTFTSWMTMNAANYPGARQSATSWVDSGGNFWLYGGVGMDSAGVSGELNDIWQFNPFLNQWTWMGGNSTFIPRANGEIGHAAVYGTSGTPNLANTPGGLDSAVGWTDKNGNLWLYGGYGFDASGYNGYFNDLWEYQPGAGNLPATAPITFSIGTGSYAAGQTLTLSDTTPGAVIYYFISGAAAATQYTAPISVLTTETIEAVAIAPGYASSGVEMATYTVAMAATPILSLSPGAYATEQMVSITDATPDATIYYAINGTPTSSSSVYGGPIAVSASETIEAFAVANGYANSAVATASYTIWPATAGNEWAWMGGLSTGAQNQQYGIKGTAAIGNIPNARTRASSWTDSSGNFWLFGGGGFNGGMNDLWTFNPPKSEWAWIGGSIGTSCATNTATETPACSDSQPGVYGTLGTPASENVPGGRQGASSWVDNRGNFWIFGGLGLDANGTVGETVLNDLWKFNPSTNNWAWISGSSTVSGNCMETDLGDMSCAQPSVYGTQGTPAAANTPGGRQDAYTWIDNKGNLWLFGGWSFDVSKGTQYYFNELWEFNPSTDQWAWMAGSSTRDGSACFLSPSSYFPICGEPGVYGVIGKPSAANLPGGRAGGVSWTDSSGNLWLFSGNGFDTSGSFGDPNDLWEFSPSTNQWAWMGGNDAVPGCATLNCTPPGVQGVLGTPAPGNIPPGRDHAAAWVDGKGNFWLYGGEPSLYDLWEFTPSANEWAWMGNGGIQEQPVYGTQGTPAPGNGPGARYAPSNWTDSNGDLWLFGGQTIPGPTIDDNDLWRYTPSAPTPVPGFAVVDLAAQANPFAVQAGTSGTTTINTVVTNGFDSAISLSTVGLPSGITATFSPGSITGAGSSQMTVSVGLNVTPGNYTLTVTGTNAGVTETTTVALVVENPPPPNFTLGVSPSSLAIGSGASGTVSLTVTPMYAFNATVTFACSGLPAGATCSFSPTTVTPSGAAANISLTISAGSSSTASNSRPFLPFTALAVGLCLFIRKKRRGPPYVILAAILVGLGLTFGCGGGGTGGGNGGGSGSTPVTSTVTITATSASAVQTTSVSLTVN